MKKDPKFLALRNKWYKKLAKTGFKDIEDVNSSREFLKSWHSIYFQKKYTPETFQEKREYFDRARDFFHVYEFETERDKKIWDLRSEGRTIREISSSLPVKRWIVEEAVKRLEQEMLNPSPPRMPLFYAEAA